MITLVAASEFARPFVDDVRERVFTRDIEDEQMSIGFLFDGTPTPLKQLITRQIKEVRLHFLRTPCWGGR